MVAKLAERGARICATDIAADVQRLAAGSGGGIVPVVADLTRAD